MCVGEDANKKLETTNRAYQGKVRTATEASAHILAGMVIDSEGIPSLIKMLLSDSQLVFLPIRRRQIVRQLPQLVYCGAVKS